jgi:hypothetical protein
MDVLAPGEGLPTSESSASSPDTEAPQGGGLRQRGVTDAVSRGRSRCTTRSC